MNADDGLSPEQFHVFDFWVVFTLVKMNEQTDVYVYMFIDICRTHVSIVRSIYERYLKF